jgi:hypothetical protein
MAMTPGAAPSRICYGWWVTLALAVIVLLSSGIRFTIGPSLFDLTGGYGAVFAVAATLLLIAAGLSIAINETVRPGRRVVSLPGRPHPVAGGR